MSTYANTCVGLIGLGNLGTAIGNLVAAKGIPVLGWEYNSAVVEEINRDHTNSRYLPGIPLEPALAATTDIRAVLESCRIVFIALPSAFILSTLQPVRQTVQADSILVNMAKGIDGDTGLTAFQTLTALFPSHPRVMLSGPTIANEFARGMPTVVVLAGENRADLMAVSQVLDTRHFRTRFSEDTIGVELGGLLKNIYAIGLGIFDGKEISSVNFRAAYLTIALEEMSRIGLALGGQRETFDYLAGLGDLLATSLSGESHNRRMGILLSQGQAAQQIKETMGVLPEGYNTLKVILNIAEKLHVSLPLAKALWDVIHGRLEADHFIFSFIRDFVD
jgi:glycerol-3-phosphate dehydrogenase (NAD(P)+)